MDWLLYDTDLCHKRVNKQTLMKKAEVSLFEHFYLERLNEIVHI